MGIYLAHGGVLEYAIFGVAHTDILFESLGILPLRIEDYSICGT